MELLKIREKLRAFYGEYSLFLDPLGRFLMVLITLLVMKNHMGFFGLLNNLLVIVMISALCAVLPRSARIVVLSVCMLANLYEVSYEALGMAAVMLVLFFVLYYIFQPGDGDLLYLVPVLFVLKVPYVFPILLGLTGTLLSVVPVTFGVILYYFLRWVVENSAILSEGSTLTTFQKLGQMTNGLLKNETMIVFIICFAVAICVVYLLRRLPVRYNWMVAIVAGVLTEFLILAYGIFSMELRLELSEIIIGCLTAFFVGMVLHYFLFLVDYSRTVMTQFEDDEYYYYVKAVPKYAIPTEARSVKTISSGEGEMSLQPKRKQSAVALARAAAKRRKAAIEARRREEEDQALQEELEESGEWEAAMEESLKGPQAAARRAANKMSGYTASRKTDLDDEAERRRREMLAAKRKTTREP